MIITDIPKATQGPRAGDLHDARPTSKKVWQRLRMPAARRLDRHCPHTLASSLFDAHYIQANLGASGGAGFAQKLVPCRRAQSADRLKLRAEQGVALDRSRCLAPLRSSGFRCTEKRGACLCGWRNAPSNPTCSVVCFISAAQGRWHARPGRAKLGH
jgi:hypothetical protein